MYLIECDKNEGLAKQAEVDFVDAAVFVSEKQDQDNLREKSKDIQPDVIVTHGQVEHVEVHREVVPRVFSELGRVQTECQQGWLYVFDHT